MIACLVGFGALGVLLVGAGQRLGRSAFAIAAIAPAASFVWAATKLRTVVDGNVVTESASWVPALGLVVDLRLDGFALTMTLLVSGIGVLVLLYSTGYFAARAPDLGRLAGLIVLFGGAMVGLVQADHLLVLYTCWELTSITSYLLIGNTHTDPDARAAALHALLVTAAGGLAMLGGFVLLGHRLGTFRVSELVDAATGHPALTGGAVTVGLVLVLVGAFTKSAQYPFHAWLPGAMVAPTPVSAYLHSATMVKAGVYLVARLAPAFAATTDLWRPLVLGVGLVTLVGGGLRALRQFDLKLLLAFGTVSQLGLLVVLFGAGTTEATTAGFVLLVAHALFKGSLFLVVGVIDHATGTRDIRNIPVVGRRWWWLEAVTIVSAASMAGVPLAAGFIAKEAAYGAFADAPFGGSSALVLAAIVGGSMLTVAYAIRFWNGAFLNPRRARATGAPATERRVDDDATTDGPMRRLAVPAAVLAAVSLPIGLAPAILDRLAGVSVSAIVGAPAAVHLAVWHGPNLALALSAVTLAGGAAVWLANRRTQQVLATGAAVPSGEAVYLVLLRSLATSARRVTAVVQSGSLPIYSGVILITAAVLPIATLLAAWPAPSWPSFTRVAEVPVAAMLVVAAVGAASVRRRFSAAIYLGAAGYAMAGLFVVYGAPDLALTQAAIETLSTVLFVLVLRSLPERFERQSSQRRRVLRLGISVAVGVAVFALAITAGGTGPVAPVSEEMVARAVPDGHGRNVVNVILVDFRALDTLGEITVLAVASIGAVALARVGRRVAEERGELDTAAVAASDDLRRIVFVDVSVQVIFHAVVMMSLWLLFAGHNQPGGGFVGGLLAGSAITLRYIAGGIGEVRGRSRFRPWTVLGIGLVMAAVTASFPLLTGGSVLDVGVLEASPPLLGDLKLSSALVFDTGVYLTVVGMILMAFEAFGDRPAIAPAMR